MKPAVEVRSVMKGRDQFWAVYVNGVRKSKVMTYQRAHAALPAFVEREIKRRIMGNMEKEAAR